MTTGLSSSKPLAQLMPGEAKHTRKILSKDLRVSLGATSSFDLAAVKSLGFNEVFPARSSCELSQGVVPTSHMSCL